MSLHDIRKSNMERIKTFLQYIDFQIFDDNVDPILRKNNLLILDLEKKDELITNEKDEMDNFIRLFNASEENRIIIEMKIVYLYKTIEINLKTLLNVAYDLSDSKKSFFNIESIISFLNEKDINIKTSKFYNDFNILRKLNNQIKHSSLIIQDKELLKCGYFKSNQYTSTELNIFYNSIKDKPRLFLKDIQDQIYNDLYVYTPERIEELSKELVKRMDNSQIENLVTSLQKHQSLTQ